MTVVFGRWRWFGVVALLVVASSCSGATTSPQASSSSPPKTIHAIRHIVVIMQESRSFESNFGTYPGADGIPMAGGRPIHAFEPSGRRSGVTAGRLRGQT